MTRRGWVLFALLGVVWGIPYLLIKVAVAELPPSALVFSRAALGAVILLPLAWRTGALADLVRHWRPLAAFAALEIVAPFWLLSDAEITLTSSTTGLLIAAVPIITVITAHVAAPGERLGALRWGGLGLGFAGVAVLAVPDLAVGSSWSVIEVLLAALGYATAPLIAARWLSDLPPLAVTTGCLGLAVAATGPAAFVTWPATVPSAPAIAAVVGLAVLCTALGFVAFFALIREVGPSRAVVITYVNPAVAVAAGAALLGEPVTASVLAAFGLILAGTALAITQPTTTTPPATVPATVQEPHHVP